MTVLNQENKPRFYETCEAFIDTANSVIAKDIYDKLSMQAISNAIPIIHIPKNIRCVKNTKPIAISLYVEEGMFFAENKNLAICGSGENKREAINDFMIHLIHFYEYYKSIDEDKLIGKAIKLKKLYSELFVEEINAD